MTDKRITEIFEGVVAVRAFRKIVFSKPLAAGQVKTEARLYAGKAARASKTITAASSETVAGLIGVQLSHFGSDNKVIHENIDVDNAAQTLAELLDKRYSNCVVITAAGNCDIKRTDKGGWKITNRIQQIVPQEVTEHDKAKKLALADTGKYAPLLHALGLADSGGGILPSRRNKYNQITSLSRFWRVACRKPAVAIYILPICAAARPICRWQRMPGCRITAGSRKPVALI